MATLETNTTLAPTEPPAPTALDRKLRGLWRRQRWHAHGRGGAMVALTAAALVLGGLLVDWLAALPAVPRLLLLAGMVAAVATVGYRQWWMQLRPYDPRRAALQVERHHRQLGSALIAYVQLGQRVDGSSQLAAAARQQAVQRSEGLSFAELVRFGDLRAPMLAALVAVSAVVGAGVQWPVAMATFGHRLVNPFSERAYPTRTQVTLVADERDRRVPRGAAVMLTAEVAGRLPSEGSLELRYADEDDRGGWEAVRLPLDAQGPTDEPAAAHAAPRLQHRLAGVDRSFAYRFRAGDGLSEQGQVTVIAPPRVRNVQVTLDHPAYTGLGERTSESLSIRAPEGTHARLHLELDRPVVKAELVELTRDGEPADEPTALELDEAGRTATLAMPVRNMHYRLRWTRGVADGAGEDAVFVFDDPVRHQVQAVPDAPPRVQVLEPTRRSQQGTVHKRLPLAFRASDDHGLTEAWLVYRREGSEEEHRVAIGELEGQSISRHEFTWSLGETVDELAEGDRLAYTIEVADNREHADGRQRGRATPWRTIEILSVEAFLRQLTERQVESIERLQQVREQSSESRDEVRRLEREAPDTSDIPEAPDTP